jgi:hypothetical protein
LGGVAALIGMGKEEARDDIGRAKKSLAIVY